MNNKYEQDLLKLNTIKEQYKRISSEVLSDSKEYSKYLSDSKICLTLRCPRSNTIYSQSRVF